MSSYLVIGDVHGCWSSLQKLLAHPITSTHQLVFAGDLFDRGPGHEELIPWVLANRPLMVMGNHDWKLLRWLRGNNVKQTHGLDVTTKVLEAHPEWKTPLRDYLEAAPHFLKLPLNIIRAVWVAHGGLNHLDTHDFKKLDSKNWGRVINNCMFGFVKDVVDGKPEREDFSHLWAGTADLCVHGHTPVDEARWYGPASNVINIDTGCVFGGKLTAITIPELEIIQVASDFNYGDHTISHPQNCEQSMDDRK